MIPEPTTTITEDLGESLGYLEGYIQRKVQIAKLDMAEQLVKVTASLATMAILVALVPVLLCVFSVGVGFYLATAFDWSIAQAFFALSGFYVLLGGVIYVFRRQLFTNPILGLVIKEVFKK